MRIHLGLLCGVMILLSACSQSTAPTASGDTGAASEFSNEPALQTDQATLDAALHCTDFTHPDKPAVLLVHGTFTAGQEQYEWNYIPLLSAQGFDVCAVTYPDRGFGDQQVSAEYVVNALRRLYAKTGRKVAMIGHSQGASMPRWAIKWWPSARNAVQDFVLEAGPNHGTTQVSDLLSLLPTPLPVGLIPAAFYQFEPDSNFTKAVNAGDETPGDIDYTTLYTQDDELVQPVSPVPTAALDWQQNNPHVSNILLQDVCPNYVADHVTIGTTDALAFALALDAISNPGPANITRANATQLCNSLLPLLPTENIGDYTVPGLVAALQSENASAIPNPHLVAAEPALMPYAQ